MTGEEDKTISRAKCRYENSQGTVALIICCINVATLIERLFHLSKGGFKEQGWSVRRGCVPACVGLSGCAQRCVPTSSKFPATDASISAVMLPLIRRIWLCIESDVETGSVDSFQDECLENAAYLLSSISSIDRMDLLWICTCTSSSVLFSDRQPSLRALCLPITVSFGTFFHSTCLDARFIVGSSRR